MAEFFQQAGWWLAHATAVLLCLVGVSISLLAISGTWLIALAGTLLVWVRPDAAPGWTVILVFLAIAAVVEVFDFVAGSLGISRRGGSTAAGWAALFGGLVGMVFGGLIPVPVIGSLIGMLVGSFVCAFLVEHRRLQHGSRAAHIAWGAVWARLSVMFVKTIAALGMAVYLWYVVLV